MHSFTVPDMSCDSCVKAITAAVRRVDPTAGVTVHLAGKTVEVRSDHAMSALSAAISEAGFEVSAPA
jgi:copper chaperone